MTVIQTEAEGAGVARPKGASRYLRAFGPGLITGASDDDPSGIATYSQAGARFGLRLIWSALLTFPLMAATQEICDRTALASGKGLGDLARERFSHAARVLIAVLITALLCANALNIAADLLAIGSGMELLGLGPPSVWAVIAGATIIALLIRGSFTRISTVFKALALSLLAYIPVVFLSDVSWGDVARNLFVPHPQASREYLLLLVAVLGTTISPYLFFWQSANRVEELRDEDLGGSRPVPLRQRSHEGAKEKQRLSRVDVFSGMALSNVVMLAIIVACAATIGKHGGVQIQSAAEAAKGLEPAGGGLAKVLFALGFIGTGMLAVPVLAGSGSAGLAGLMGKRWGFSRSIREAPVFYALVVLGTAGGAAFSLVGVNPIRLLVIVGLVNALAAAPFLVIVMVIASDHSIMGDYKNGWLARVLGWVTVLVMSAGALALIALS
jgi:NRAMP (natural resistance-associated macrophage protein)-like metal ion transporter